MSTPNHQRPTIALVYDHLTTQFGGAEVVLEQLHQLYPNAPLYSTVADTSKAVWANGWQIQTTFLQRLPDFIRSRHRWHALVAPLAIELLDLAAYDIVISISAGVAKGVLARPEQLHVCYLLSPTRHLFDELIFEAYPILKIPGVHWLVQHMRGYLRWWDVAAAQRPDKLISLSKLISGRVSACYQRSVDACLYPPFRQRLRTQSGSFKTQLSEPYDLIISRLVWYKRVEVAVAAALQTRRKLAVIGTGPAANQLHRLAGTDGVVRHEHESLEEFLARANKTQAVVVFFGVLPDADTDWLLQHCRSLLMLGKEDFGMTALEALAAGKPVIIDGASGVAEVLTDRQHGRLLPLISVETVVAALSELDQFALSPALLKQTALRYSDTVFRQQFAALINRMWREKDNYVDNA